MDARRSRLMSLAVLATLTIATLGACARRREAGDSARAVSTLRRQAEDWDRAILAKDERAIASNMSEDFRHIDKEGALSDRKAFLRDLMSPDLVIHPYAVEDFDIRVYGTCALLCGRTRMTGTYQGRPFRSHYRYIDTYAYANGAWKVVSVQISPMPQP